jgi:exosortase D (VPLPA-CTERM-specific)
MNSLRIGFIGITVDRWGSGMAEGALHDFEGWVVFMFSTGALILTAYGLRRIGRSRVKWSQTFSLDPVAPAVSGRSATTGSTQARQSVPQSFIAASVLVLIGAAADVMAPAPSFIAPPREAFDAFPGTVGDWVGQREQLQSVYLDGLRLDDYVLANYRSPAGDAINFYAAYYESQDASRAIHSPRDCIPGGGWKIEKLEQRQFPAVGSSGAFPINRAIIQFGSNRQIVYYWFQERGRYLTNEYVARWYLFWDALTQHRTDGALVRFVTPVPSGADESDVDAKLTAFASRIVPTLGRYIPN